MMENNIFMEIGRNGSANLKSGAFIGPHTCQLDLNFVFAYISCERMTTFRYMYFFWIEEKKTI